MKKFAAAIFMAAVALLVGFDLGLAQEAAEAATGGDGNYLKAAIFIGSCIGAGVGMGLGAIGPGIGMGHAVRGALEGMARNPGTSGKLMTTMLIGMAMMESLAIYALVIALILLFSNPFL